MNPYALRRKHLKLVRLPISPPPHWGNFRSIPKTGKSMVVLIQPVYGNCMNGRLGFDCRKTNKKDRKPGGVFVFLTHLQLNE